MNVLSCAGKSRLDIDLEPQNGQVLGTKNRANHHSLAESTKAGEKGYVRHCGHGETSSQS
jgi:hypothetical protein